MFDTTSTDSNGFNLVVNQGIGIEADSLISSLHPASITPGIELLSAQMALNSVIEALTVNSDPASNSPLFLFDNQASLTNLTSTTNTATETTQASLDPLLGTSSNEILVGSSQKQATIQATAVVSGTLASTDPTTPDNTRFRDDYLLTDLIEGEEVQVNLDASFDSLLVLINANNGKTLTYNNNSNRTPNSQLNFTVEAGVNYIIRSTSLTPGATGNYNLTTNFGTPRPATIIGSNNTITGTLANSDPINPTRTGTLSDDYLLRGVVPGQAVQVNLKASFDTYLQIVNADTGVVLAINDDASGSINSQVGFRVEAGINYLIRATSFSRGATGAYTLTTQRVALPGNYDLNYGYGLIDAGAAVADAIGANPFPSVPNLGGNSWNLDMIDAPEVWAQGYTGQGVVVAVVDSGVDYTHPDLANNIWTNSGEIPNNGIDDDGNGYVDDVRGWNFVDGSNNPMDLNGHGTHVSGTIAAENNNLGMTGVAYNATIMPVRVMSSDGYGSSVNIANGIRYAANNGANVINLSLGGNYSSLIQDAVNYATSVGAVVVMGSGNQGNTQPGAPAFLATQSGIAVGAVDINRAIANFSNQAGVPVLNYVVAPGVNVYSTFPGNSYRNLSGTSMATPQVSGVVALMLSANPQLTPLDVESLINQTATTAGVTV